MKPVALCLILAVWFGGCGSAEPSKVKVHAVGFVDGKPLLMFTALYRADASRQTVLWWVEGGPDSPLALENCAVRDALNWRCEAPQAQAVGIGPWSMGATATFTVLTDGWKFLTESEWKALQAQQK